MAKDIDTYLKELQRVLGEMGADPALVQDALFDAEEHLRTEMAERYGTEPASVDEYQSRFATVAEDYGTPQEVAAAYQTSKVHAGPAADDASAVSAAPATDSPNAAAVPTVSESEAPSATGGQRPSALRQIFGVVVDPAAYKSLLYMLLSLATGVVYFTVVVTGVSTSLGMIILIVGLPLFLVVLGLVRGMALIEGRLVEALLGTRMPRRERADLPESSWLERVSFWFKDGRTWASMAYMLLMLPLGIAYFTIAVTGLATGVALIGSPIANWASDFMFTWQGVEHVFSIPSWASPLAVVGGFAVLLFWLHLIRWIGRGHAAFAKSMLVRLDQ